MDENPPLPREITQGIKPRQPFGSEAEAIKALRKASEIPNKAARILGRDHAAALSRLLQGNEVLELDGLQMSEVLTIPELAWYTMILPEFRAFRLKLQDIALGMSGNMPKQLKSQFSNIFTADGTCRKPEKLLEMYGDITIGMCNHLRLKGYFTFRNGRITELEDLLIMFFAISMENALQEYFSRNHYAYQLALGTVRQILSETRLPQKGHLCEKARTAASDTVMGLIERISQELKPLDSELNEDVEVLFDEVFELSITRKIDPITIETSDLRLEITEDLTYWTITRPVILCEIRVRNVRTDAFLMDFTIDRASGQVQIGRTILKTEYFEGTAAPGRVIRRVVLLALRSYLHGKNEDFVHDIPVRESGTQVIEERRSAVEAAVTTLEPPAETQPEEVFEPTWTFDIGIELARKRQPEPEEALAEEAEERAASFDFSLLKRDSAAVRRGLERLNVTIARISGSHHMCISPSGARAPIPFKDRKELGKGLLRKVLKMLEISPQELHEAM